MIEKKASIAGLFYIDVKIGVNGTFKLL